MLSVVSTGGDLWFYVSQLLKTLMTRSFFPLQCDASLMIESFVFVIQSILFSYYFA